MQPMHPSTTNLDEAGLDVLIIHELGKDEELLPQKLEGEVHLKIEPTMSCNLILKHGPNHTVTAKFATLNPQVKQPN